MAIFVIAGHHDRDPGAVNPRTKQKEADETKELAAMVTERIKQMRPDIEVWNDDPKDTLSQVISKVRERIKSTDILCDIHFNSASSDQATGMEVIVSKNAGKKSIAIAKDLVEIIPKVIGINNRGVKTESQTARGRIGILNLTGAAVLPEIAFISNEEDMRKYEQAKHWTADEIARVLIKHHG